MPGSPRDNTDALLRELRDLRREVERLKRHRHPIGRNTPSPGVSLPFVRVTNNSCNVPANSLTTVNDWAGSFVLGDAISVDDSSGVFTINEDGLYFVAANGTWSQDVPSSSIELRNASNVRIDGFYDGRLNDVAAVFVEPTNLIANASEFFAGTEFRLRAYQNGLGGAADADLENIVMTVVQFAPEFGS